MKLSKKEENELLQVYNTWWHSYLNGDIKTYDSFLDDDFKFVGSTDGEEFLNKDETTSFLKATADQLAGKAKLENIDRTIETFEGMVLFTDLADAYILDNKKWVYYARFRFTSLMRRTSNGWRFFYQHFSTPDLKAEEGETLGHDKVSIENLELRNAIKRRTAELEIKNRELAVEASLERIRAKVTMMQQSSDLLDIVVTMRNEFTTLGHRADYFWHMAWHEDKFEKSMTSGDGSHIGMIMELPRDFHSHYKGMDDWEANEEPVMVLALEIEEALDYLHKMVTLGDFKQVDPNAPSEDDIRHIGGITFVMARTSHGEIGYSLPGVVEKPPKDDLLILERFASVFDLAYRRFLDLQKAEKQAREVEIELSLEKVRSRTMAMQHSDELLDVASVMFQQIKGLGVAQWNCGFNIWEMGDRECTYYPGSPDGNIIPFSCKIPLNDHPIFKRFEESKKDGVELLIYEKEGEEQKDHYDYMLSLSGVGDFLRSMMDADFELPAYQIDHVANFAYGNLLFITYEPFPEMHEVFKRFANVFEQTYTRFLDLQKAEEQAKEAQIEAGLERIRSKSMSMSSSEDIGETVATLFEELVKIGHSKTARTGIGIFDDSKYIKLWSAITDPDDEAVLRTGQFDMTLNPSNIKVKKAWEDGDKDFYFEMKGPELIDYYKTINEAEDYELKIDMKDLPEKEYWYQCYFKYGIFYAIDQFHISEETKIVFAKFAKVFEQIYTRFLDLQKAESQAREAQIEGALERVRSKTMAMHSSSDVKETVKTFFDEVLQLGIDKSIRCGIGILEGHKGMETWSANADDEGEVEMRVGMLNMGIHPMLVGLKKAWDNGEKGYSYNYSKNDVLKYYTALNNEPEYPFNADLDNLPKKEVHQSFFFSSGIIFTFTENPLTDESSLVLHRFAEVFGQTYRRYLDLRKAEGQAREAQIEASLEKVRSRSLAMQRSNDLSMVIKTISEELNELNIRYSNVSFGIDSDDSDYVFWTSISGQSDPVKITVPYIDSPITKSISEARKNKQNFLIDFFPTEIHSIWLNHAIENSALNYLTKDEKENLLNLPLTRSAALLPSIFLVVANYRKKPYSDADNDIIARFGQVFEQSYRRFLDLEKAEQQAREAKIEAALERVRASSLAMHKSEQLPGTAKVLFEQFDLLGIIPDRISIAIYKDSKRLFELWATDQTGNLVDHDHHFSIDEPTCMNNIFRAWKAGNDTCIVDLKGRELKKWIQYVKNEAEMLIDESQFEGRRVQHAAFFSHGFLLLSSHLPISDDMMQLLLRFTKVFEQSYTRFLDLKKAENQAGEAIKRASVDRVRAEIATMRTATDLNRITPLIWNELTTLNVPFIRCGVFIMDEEKQQVQTHLSTPDGKALASFQLNFDDTEPLHKLLPHWRKKELYTDHWDKQGFIDSTKILMEKGAISSKETYLTKNQPDNLYLHFLPFLQGMLYVGSEVPLTKDELSLVQNLAEAFSSAYARYEDFNRLELANKKIEKTLVDLKLAQSQLVQSEKMASLGELTAGIAHEIQNPLNFVNNFSEVSVELLEEMYEEIKKGEVEEALEIGSDIEQNLQKIHHHGQRASEIVKGMLQHSRSNTGERELIDINALTDEYLRLAYHGLRAKDKTFNAKMETKFDPEIEKIKVIPQDIGRVILNLITNAFYAVDQKKKKVVGDFEPRVAVSTKKIKGGLEIEVLDNGNGIPNEVLEKIFQPFFTTKPTGQGTGLGLSLSYDIINAHGGVLKVETKEGEGSKFLIKLPV